LIEPLLADRRRVSDLLDVFSAYDGNVLFRGLTEGVGGQPAGPRQDRMDLHGPRGALRALGLRPEDPAPRRARARWARSRRRGSSSRSWWAGPSSCAPPCRRADAVYETSAGRPAQPHGGMRQGRLRHARAQFQLFLTPSGRRRWPSPRIPGGPRGPAQRGALISSANDGSVLGYLEAFGVAVWDTASDYASGAAQTWNGMVRIAAMATGLGSAMLKCLLIALTIVPLYLLLLLSAAIVWFMEQLRFFLAVTGTMMLPLFTGMFSLPEGHPNRQAAQSYVMHMVSLALWPVAWAIGHTGTIALYNALISLIAGTSRVPDMVDTPPVGARSRPAPRRGPAPGGGGGARKLVHGQHGGAPLDPGRGPGLHALGCDRVGPRPRVPAQAARHRGPLHDAGGGPVGRGQSAAAGRFALSSAQGRGATLGLFRPGRSPRPGERLSGRPGRCPRGSRSLAGPHLTLGRPPRRRPWRELPVGSMFRMARAGPACESGRVALPPLVRSGPCPMEPSGSWTGCSASPGAVLVLPAPGVHAAVPPEARGAPGRGAARSSSASGPGRAVGMTLDQLSPARPESGPRHGPAGGWSCARRSARVQELGAADAALRHASAWTRPFVFAAPRRLGRSPGRPGPSTGRPCRRPPRASCTPAAGIVIVLGAYHLGCPGARRAHSGSAAAGPGDGPPGRPQIHGQGGRPGPSLRAPMPDTLKVNLGDRSYPILFAEDLTEEVRAICLGARAASGGRRFAVVTDSNVANIQAKTLKRPLRRRPDPHRSLGRGVQVDPELGRAWTSSPPGPRQVRRRVRGGRRRRGGPGGVCRGVVPARDRLLPGAHDAPRDGGQLGRREDGHQPQGGQEPGRGLPPAQGRLHRHGLPEDCSPPRVRGGHGRGDQDGAPRRRGCSSPSSSAPR
jgi:hypothetical protein